MRQKIIDLTHTLNPDTPSWDGGCCFETKVFLDYKDCEPPTRFRVQTIEGKAGCGTHIDAPSHCIEGGVTIESLKLENLVADCVVIKAVGDVSEDYLIMPDAVEDFEKENGKIKPNTFVIFHTGWDKRWDTPDAYRNNLKFPSIHEDTAKLLLERNVTGIGIDTLSPDADGTTFPVHVLFLGAGKYLVENIANSGELPPTGSKVFIMPMKIEGATESPIRLIALI